MDITTKTLTQQYTSAKQRWDREIMAAQKRHDLPRFLLYAVGSRESDLQNIVGDGGHGHGIWQLDDRSHQIPKPFPVAQQADMAASLLRSLLDACRGDVIAACAAYNEGLGNEQAAKRAGNPDAYTTGHDYGEDVEARRRFLVEKFGHAGG